MAQPAWSVLVEHFDGSRWYRRSAPLVGVFPMLTGVSADASNDVWAVGHTLQFDRRGVERDVTLAEHWDGTKWRVTPTVNPNARQWFLTVKAFTPNDVWAAGFTAPSKHDGHALIEHWNGTVWSIVPSPAGSGTSSIIYTLTGIAPDEVWALGQVLESHSLLAERWDGTQWSKVFVGQPQDGTSSFRASFEAGLNDVWGFGSQIGNQTLAENFCTY